MRKRKLIYIPKLYPGTFVFFNQKGDDQTSFSIRDYSKTPVDERWGKTHFPGMKADQILRMAVAVEPAKAHHIKDDPTWKKWISEANIRYEEETGEKMKFKMTNIAGAALADRKLPDDLKGKYERWMAIAPRRAKAGKSYFVGHDGVPSTGGFSNRGEEHLAMALFNRYRLGTEIMEFDGIRTNLLDYQFPLKAAQSDRIGKIDLIGLDNEGRACVIELKAWDNTSDTPEKALWQALKYTAAVEANISDIRQERQDIRHDKPAIFIMAPSQYWGIHANSETSALTESIERELSIPVRFVKINVDKEALKMGLNNTKPQITGAVSFELMGGSI